MLRKASAISKKIAEETNDAKLKGLAFELKRSHDEAIKIFEEINLNLSQGFHGAKGYKIWLRNGYLKKFQFFNKSSKLSQIFEQLTESKESSKFINVNLGS